MQDLVKLINAVCGLGEYWAKVCLYYCMATHHLPDINWMPVLDIVAMWGSGKSQLIKVLERLCFQPYVITCHQKMTTATLKNLLMKAKDGTAIIEEGNLYPNRKELESYLINRVDKSGTSTIAVTVQVPTANGLVWVTEKYHIFGATIVHDRHEMVDMAADRRAISVPIKKQKGKIFVKPDDRLLNSLRLPSFGFGNVPDIFNSPETTGSALDAWEPLIRVAESTSDEDWLNWAWDKLTEMNERLADGQEFELEMEIFSAIIKAYNDKFGYGIVPGVVDKNPMPLSDITRIVKEQSEFIHPKTVATKLRNMGFRNIRKIGGVSMVCTTTVQIKKIAKQIGYEDDQL